MNESPWKKICREAREKHAKQQRLDGIKQELLQMKEEKSYEKIKAQSTEKKYDFAYRNRSISKQAYQ